jgi:hypothetical protein
MTALAITPVRFEHHREPLGIGDTRPRLSWVVTAAPAGWSQAGYDLQARSADGSVESCHADSNESVLVAWPFTPLAARQRREVRVGLAAGGTTVWSDWAPVEAGLVDASDWTAQMVGPAAGSPADVASPLLRTAFTLPASPVVRARLYGSAHGVAEFYLNGARVGQDLWTPGWTAYQSRLNYAAYDVTDLLRAGANVAGVWLADGWWRGHLGWSGEKAIYGTDLGALVQLEVDHADGTRTVVVTSPAWEAGPSPLSQADFYDGEHCDARQFDPAWCTPEGLGGGWSPVAVRAFDPAILVARPGPAIRVTETLPVQEVLTSPSGQLIVDFGQNLVGRLRIAVQGQAGDIVTLRHAEVLEAGELATRPLRDAQATDSYTLAGGGVEEWAPRFTQHGFRYAAIEGWPGEFDPAALTAEVIGTDLERTGQFACSDDRVNRWHDNVWWSLRGNFTAVPTDCPQRDERLGWTGDIQVFAPAAAFLADVSGFLTGWLADLAAEQARLGSTPSIVPAVTLVGPLPTAGWSDAATVVPWVLADRYADPGVLERQFESMKAWVDQVDALAGESHLWDSGYQYGDWLDPAAPPERPDAARTPPEVCATAYFARSARLVADAAAVLGRAAEAAHYGALADAVREAFRCEYVTPAGRLMADAATAYALALGFGLLDGEDQRRRAADRLAGLVRDERYRIPTGFIGTAVILDALTEAGHADVAYRLFLQPDCPGWLYAVGMGATTIWERWDSLLPDGSLNPGGMTSFNHYAFGAVADWLHRVVAGLAPAAPGYRAIRVAPQIPAQGLTWAKAELLTPYGRAAAGWSLEGGTVEVWVDVPWGTTADVVLPSGVEYRGLGPARHAFQEPFTAAAPAP